MFFSLLICLLPPKPFLDLPITLQTVLFMIHITVSSNMLTSLVLKCFVLKHFYTFGVWVSFSFTPGLSSVCVSISFPSVSPFSFTTSSRRYSHVSPLLHPVSVLMYLHFFLFLRIIHPLVVQQPYKWSSQSPFW